MKSCLLTITVLVGILKQDSVCLQDGMEKIASFENYRFTAP